MAQAPSEIVRERWFGKVTSGDGIQKLNSPWRTWEGRNSHLPAELIPLPAGVKQSLAHKAAPNIPGAAQNSLVLGNSLGTTLAVSVELGPFRNCHQNQVLGWDSLAKILSLVPFQAAKGSPPCSCSSRSVSQQCRCFGNSWHLKGTRYLSWVTALLRIQKRVFLLSTSCCQHSTAAALLCLKCCPAVLLTSLLWAHLVSVVSLGQGTVGNCSQIVFRPTE